MGTCTLEFTRNSPLRTTLVDGTSGQVIYQIDTPIRILVGHVTRVRKLDLPPQSPLILGDKAHSDICDDLTDKEKKKGGFKWNEMFKTDLPQTSDEIGRINWKFFSPSGFDFKGKVTNQREFLPECGKTKNFKFTGPDGVEYKWALGAMGTNYPKLVTMDGKKTEIAKFHNGSCFLKRKKARLEIQPAGMDMLDQIILTFVFVEDKRRARESRASGGAGVGG